MKAKRRAAGRIFISYLKQDAAFPAGWLYDRLAARYGQEQVFKGVDSINPGENFAQRLTEAVGACEVLLLLIGPKWLATTTSVERPSEDADNFVQLEIQAALDRSVVLIPVLVDGAKLPQASELPPSLASMVRRQALELSSDNFGADADLLLKHVDRIVRPHKRLRVRTVLAILACTAIAVGGLFALNREPAKEVACWNGERVKQDESCPQLKSLAAFEWAFPWTGSKANRPTCESTEVTGDGEVETFVCYWADLRESGSHVVFERWPTVKTAKRYFGDANSAAPEELLVRNESGTFDNVGWTWKSFLGEQEDGKRGIVSYFVYDKVPLTASSFGLGKTDEGAMKNRDTLNDRFRLRTGEEIATVLRTLEK